MTEAPRRSPWFQFSLRTLLVLMLAVGAYFAGFATSQKLSEKAIQDARDKGAAEAHDAALAEVKAHQEAAWLEWASQRSEIGSPKP